MTKTLIAAALLAASTAASAQALTYNVTTTWFEPQTQPRNSIFEGSFVYDAQTHGISGLTGRLSESMTDTNGKPVDADHMVWLDLNHQLQSWRDAALGGTFAAVFRNGSTDTFIGGGWTPQYGVDTGSVYAGFPVKASNPGNAYALIFVPDTPTAALTQAQINQLAYADCVPTAAGGMMMGGGMMGAVCMTGISADVYGTAGTMDGYPVSQTITLAQAVPEPGSYAMLLAGLGALGFMAKRRRS